MALFPKARQQERRGGGGGTPAAKKTTPRKTKQVIGGEIETKESGQGRFPPPVKARYQTTRLIFGKKNNTPDAPL